ncbi:LysR family transcriptional regulator [Pediococcus pentosaceus]|jgi:DNA-binding transcriptional LysR family regulator|uniref:LysR family transcriptional regulator n=1 Tax=Pediococcus pentosaceus TaxID=1255 RepID=A0A6L5A216_PEDPE|nr:LysR family transcriptional regulator [Pediococcus pentosaceus]KAF0351647.1 LysR family transcriptional regulator [Pediococcus pentosaceus]KAF0414004.1 LysR family transcriptional regulator [Pediococcus pentosaceus]KAF0503414.1 LysR family transcriptional regulator [Pediococcus pentosaceus]MBF7106132.1 LysR family transcriptional regulator [Pediococcus pentosaceus]MBF7109062.1 LysR family transcriptional regulator [Pediococcus pentosaceus]
MFQQMQYFIDVVDAHSFTQAAADDNISQSAISQQIKELENNLGVLLLKRQGRSFEITPAGQYFYQHSRDVLGQVKKIVKDTIRIANDNEPELRVGYLKSFGTTEFLQTVAEFSKSYPEVKIKINNGTHEQLYDWLREEKIDLAFSDQRRAPSNEYVNDFLTESGLMVAVSQTGEFSHAEQIDVADLADLPCILITDSKQQLAEETYYQEILGVKGGFRLVANYDEAQMLIAANQGYLIVNQRTQNLLDSGIIQTVPLHNGGHELTQKYYMYWKVDNSGFYIETFAEMFEHHFK